MRLITDPSDVDEPDMQRLLKQRFDQLAEYELPLEALGRWHLVQHGDHVNDLLFDADNYDSEPSWEWVQDHDGFFEAVFVFDDSGFGHVYLIPDREDIDTHLLMLCHRYATKPGEQVNP